jgi:hypothetical protein
MFNLAICPIPGPRGSECTGEPGFDTPYGLCEKHFEKIALEYHHPDVFPVHNRCEYCAQIAMFEVRFTGIKFCSSCGRRESGLKGETPVARDVRQPRADLPVFRERPVEVVYYLRFGDRVKIGTTRDLKARIKAIYHDEVLAVEQGGVAAERMRHLQFAKHIITGQREWFSLAPELVAHINELRTDYGQPMAAIRKWQAAN